MGQLIFGYGSLISKESRDKTSTVEESFPVRVRDLKREWNLVYPPWNITGLGVVLEEGYSCNGVVIEVSEEAFPDYNKREVDYGYRRIALNLTKIDLLDGRDIQGRVFWVYVPDEPGEPTKKCPIRQSYLDTVLSGCLEHNEDFAREFIRTTYGWHNWVNDRSNPRYPRSVQNPPVKLIDRMLREELRDLFCRIE